MEQTNTFLKRTWAEIHLDRLEKNLDILKSRLTEKTRPACVIKANAYGHGDKEIMRCCEERGIDFFAVSNIHEAIRLRNAGCKGDILILGWTGGEYAPILVENDIIQSVLSAEHAKELAKNSGGKSVRVHIAIDTGMGRIGLLSAEPDKCAEEIAEIYKMNGIKAEGAFTHFAVADSYDKDCSDYTEMQKERFFDVIKRAEKLGIKLSETHCLNSAASLIHYDERSTIARFGIVLYGLRPDHKLPLPEGIEPVMELRSVVAYIKMLKKGESVSYGRIFTAEHDMKVATIPVGYADGYSRLLSGKNEVIINGCRAHGIGRICMDQMMVDVSDIPDIKVGDEVTLFGKDTVTADDLAEIYGTIGYELVCGINGRVPRVYMKNGKIVEINEIL